MNSADLKQQAEKRLAKYGITWNVHRKRYRFAVGDLGLFDFVSPQALNGTIRAINNAFHDADAGWQAEHHDVPWRGPGRYNIRIYRIV